MLLLLGAHLEDFLEIDGSGDSLVHAPQNHFSKKDSQEHSPMIGIGISFFHVKAPIPAYESKCQPFIKV